MKTEAGMNTMYFQEGKDCGRPPRAGLEAWNGFFQSAQNQPWDILILDFRSPKLEDNTFLHFKPLVCGYFHGSPRTLIDYR